MPSPSELFPIGVVSLLTGLKPHVLRRWEQQGLVAPVRVGKARRRMYSWRDIEQIQLLRHLMEHEKLSPLQARAAVQEGWPRFVGWERRIWGRQGRPPGRGGPRYVVALAKARPLEELEE
jgi:hypothetical protein